MATRSKTQFVNCSAVTKLSIGAKTNKNTPLPPPISAQEFNKEGRFNAEAVMSRNADGSVLSRFKDSSWDFSGLENSTTRVSIMHFNLDERLSNEVKTIIKLIMLTPTNPRQSVERYVRIYHLVKRIAAYCCAENTTLKSLINTCLLYTSPSPRD